MKSPDWLRILTASPRQRLPGGVQLRLLTAQEVLEARREATALAGEDRDRALCSNACLVARAVVRRGRPVYGSGEEVLHRLTVGQVETLARRWMAFYQEEGLGTGLERSRLDQLKKPGAHAAAAPSVACAQMLWGAADGGTGQGDEGGGLPVVRGQPSVR